MCEIKRPIGLDSICSIIDDNCKKANLFKKTGLKPSNLLVQLDTGCGRSSVVEYAVDMYKAHDLIDFSSGLDDSIKITFDGSLGQFKKCITEIKTAAVFKNNFTGIIEVDAMALSRHCGEVQYNDFFSSFKEICDSAFVIFFTPIILSRVEESFVDKICSSFDIKRVCSTPYTTSELRDIVEKNISSYGVEICSSKKVKIMLLRLISDCGIKTIKEAVDFADSIIKYADCTDTPTIGEYQLKLFDSNKNK